MNTIRFDWNPGLWAYDADSDDPIGVGTKSGIYVLTSEAQKRERVLENEIILQGTIIEAIQDTLDGKEPSDFMQSFSIVRSIWEKLQEFAKLREDLEHCREMYKRDCT